MSDIVRFKRKFSEQLDFMRDSCERWDEGKHHEAFRIGSAIRTIFHDSPTSLLTSLKGWKNTNVLTTVITPDAPIFGGRLSAVEGFGPQIRDCRYVPRFVAMRNTGQNIVGGEFVRASKWWKQVVYGINADNHLSRRDLVLFAVNQDGGAHVDRELNPKYRAIVEGRLLVRKVTGVGRFTVETYRIPDSHLADLRQMGHELLHSPTFIALAA